MLENTAMGRKKTEAAAGEVIVVVVVDVTVAPPCLLPLAEAADGVECTLLPIGPLTLVLAAHLAWGSESLNQLLSEEVVDESSVQ